MRSSGKMRYYSLYFTIFTTLKTPNILLTLQVIVIILFANFCINIKNKVIINSKQTRNYKCSKQFHNKNLLKPHELLRKSLLPIKLKCALTIKKLVNVFLEICVIMYMSILN